MDKQSKKISRIFLRYIIIFLAGIGNLYLIYKLLTPITIHTLNIILSIFTNTTLVGNIIQLNTISIEIVPACVAGAAFYLLFLLILSTADIKHETRIKAIISSFAILFALNILRILILIPMANASYFETVHWIFWHIVSTIFVVAIWFHTVKTYKIKSIPIYTDIKYIKSLIKRKKPKRKKKNK